VRRVLRLASLSLSCVCRQCWPPLILARDVRMSLSSLRGWLCKSLLQLPRVEVAALPTLVYQLLLLASRGHRGFVLSGLVQFLDALALARLSLSLVLCHSFSTTLLHVGFAARHDASDAVHLLRQNVQVPSLFRGLGVLLCGECGSS
jgi:hypothetical protein